MRNILIVQNPFAGSYKDDAKIKVLTDRLTDAGIQWTLDVSMYNDYLEDKYSDAPALPYTDVVCCGGDGTLHSLINAFKRHDVTIAVYPIGSANDFYAKAGGERDFDAIIKRIIHNEYRLIDIAQLNNRRFINNAGIGLDAETLKIVDKVRKLKIKKHAYKVSAAIELMLFKAQKGKFTIDGLSCEREFMIATISNGSYFGGGMMISPHSELDDGYLELILLKKTNRVHMLRLFSMIYEGKHVGDKDVEIFSGKSIKIETEKPMTYHCEGELGGSTPIEINVIEKGLRIIV